MTVHLDESIMMGTRLMSGSVAMKVQKGHHGRFAFDETIIHIDIDDLCAILYLLACDIEGPFKIIRQQSGDESEQNQSRWSVRRRLRIVDSHLG